MTGHAPNTGTNVTMTAPIGVETGFTPGPTAMTADIGAIRTGREDMVMAGIGKRVTVMAGTGKRATVMAAIGKRAIATAAIGQEDSVMAGIGKRVTVMAGITIGTRHATA